MLKGKKLLFLISGSIACYKACELISLLVKAGVEVRVACTESALNFIGMATLEGLTGHKVYTNTFESGDMMSHISLTRWCDFSLLYPGSANTVAKFAQGISDNLVTSLHLAMPETVPQFVAPAMNTKMLDNVSTQENLQRLSRKGVVVLPTEKGLLACKEEGFGKLLSAEDTFMALLEFFDTPSKNILITGGGTEEPIDGVRSLTNFSSGKTSVDIANQLSLRGHSVTLLIAKNCLLSVNCKQVLRFTDYKSIKDLLSTELSTNSFDYVIQSAAISDYSVDKIETGSESLAPKTNLKISSNEDVSIKLKKNKKIVNSLKEHSINKNIKIIAFKLTQNLQAKESLQKVNDIFKRGLVDFVVHNDLSKINRTQHKFDIYNSTLNRVKSGETKQALAYGLGQLIKEDSRYSEPLKDIEI